MEYNEKEFEFAYKNWKPRIRNYLFKKYGAIDNVEDLINDAFIAAKIYIGQYDPEKSSFKTWITNIAENKVRWDFKRNKIHTISLDMEITESHKNLYEVYDAHEILEDESITKMKAKIIVDAINSLEPVHRDILILRELEGHSYLELSEILNIGLSTAKNRVKKGRELIRQKVRYKFKLIDEL